jgi:hypothetical protein
MPSPLTNFTTAQLRDPQIQAAHRAVVKILLRDGTSRIAVSTNLSTDKGKCLL